MNSTELNVEKLTVRNRFELLRVIVVPTTHLNINPYADFVIEGDNIAEVPETTKDNQEVTSDLHIQTVCMSCGTPFGPMSYSTAMPCFACTGLCHSHCLQNDCCFLCQKTADVREERLGAKRKQQQQAEKMVEHSAKRFKPAEVCDTVLVPIPDVDSGRCE